MDRERCFNGFWRICCPPSLYSLSLSMIFFLFFLKFKKDGLWKDGIMSMEGLSCVCSKMSYRFLMQDPDDTLKRKTFELLYKMTKSSNVEVIVDRMIDYMISINDNHYKTEIASRCVELAEQFAPSNHWFIQV